MRIDPVEACPAGLSRGMMVVLRAMTQLKALSTAVLVHISKLLNVPLKGMVAVIGLLDEGATVPFIARYRKIGRAHV